MRLQFLISLLGAKFDTQKLATWDEDYISVPPYFHLQSRTCSPGPVNQGVNVEKVHPKEQSSRSGHKYHPYCASNTS
jgi:hypothetical protein